MNENNKAITTPPTFVNGVTPLNAENLNKLSTAITETKTQLDDMGTNINNVATYKGRTIRPVITFISDDARVEDYTVLKDIFISKGVPCCTAVSSGKIPTSPTTFCSLDQLKELQNVYGWEILSHSMTHARLTECTDEELVIETKGSKDKLNELGLKCRGMAIPYGYYDERVKRECSKHFDYVRGSGNEYETGGAISPIDTYGIVGVWMDSSSTIDSKVGHAPNTLEYYKWFIDKCYENNAWLVISTHSWEIKEWGFQSLLGQVIDYAKTKAEITTFEKAFSYFQNTLDAGLYVRKKYAPDGFFVGSDGSVESKHITGKRLTDNTVNNNTKPSEFENGLTTICSLNRATANGMPENNSPGSLITYAFSEYKDYAYYFQLYKIRANSNLYIRYGIDENTWSSFTQIGSGGNGGNSVTLIDNTKTPDTLIGSFITNAITVSTVTNANNANAPVRSAGILTTYKFSGDPRAWVYQTYTVRNNKHIFKRVLEDDDTWGTWTSEIDDETAKLAEQNTFNGLTPITSFRIGVTINTITGGVADEGLPKKVAGILTTYRVDGYTHSFNYQTFREIRSTNIYTRSCANATGWDTWVKITTGAIV